MRKYTREHKGKSTLSFIKDFVVIDLETTGFDTKYDEIIEIGLLRVRGDAIVDVYQTLVKPENAIPDFITDKTGITNAMVSNAPYLNEVIKSAIDFIGGDVVLGHNVHFDVNFMYDASVDILGIPLKNNLIDTLRISRKLIKDSDNHKLDTLCRYFDIKERDLHRSIKDCELCLDLYLALGKYAVDQDIDISCIQNIQRHRTRIGLKASDITPEVDTFDESHPLYDKSICFTGKLDAMTRKEAMLIAVNLGAICTDNIISTTNYLILGDNSYNPILKGKKSSKHKKALQMQLDGKDIEILSERVFYDLIVDHQ